MKTKEMSVAECNRIIAEFMGFTPRTDLHTEGKLMMQEPITEKGQTHSACYIVDKNDDKFDEFVELQYHKSFDWLMKVLNKITDLNPEKGRTWFEYQISRSHCRIYCNNGLEWKNNGGTTLDAIHKSISQFIEWYNEQKNK